MQGLEALVGNGPLKGRLGMGRGLSHAYILAGPAGCGKRTLAGILTATLVCSGDGEHPCARCADCRKVREGIHPDVLRLGDDGKSINVEKVRKLRSDAYIRPNEAARKVYILENAQTMNGSAQNALLKLLEDGPPYVSFLLLTDNVGSMLTTVRSRCELLNLSPVTPAEGERYLLSRFPALPQEQVREAARRCEGVLGQAVTRLEGSGEEADQIRQTAIELLGLLKAGREPALLEFCVGLEKWDRDKLSQLMDETVQQLRDGLLKGDEPRRCLRLVDHCKELKGALACNVGPGHIAGWLCAGTFDLG